MATCTKPFHWAHLATQTRHTIMLQSARSWKMITITVFPEEGIMVRLTGQTGKLVAHLDVLFYLLIQKRHCTALARLADSQHTTSMLSTPRIYRLLSNLRR